MTVKLVTYNAELRVFANIKFEFKFGEGGSIAVKYNLYTLRVEMYSTPEDAIRCAVGPCLIERAYGNVMPVMPTAACAAAGTLA